MKVTYRANNSGGRWWLTDGDWKALEAAGWSVEWCALEVREYRRPDTDGRWLGALAVSASIECETPGDAMRAFESVTKQTVSDEGCNCCGAPHEFSWELGDGRGSAYGSECLGFMRERDA